MGTAANNLFAANETNNLTGHEYRTNAYIEAQAIDTYALLDPDELREPITPVEAFMNIEQNEEDLHRERHAEAGTDPHFGTWEHCSLCDYCPKDQS